MYEPLAGTIASVNPIVADDSSAGYVWAKGDEPWWESFEARRPWITAPDEDDCRIALVVDRTRAIAGRARVNSIAHQVPLRRE